MRRKNDSLRELSEENLRNFTFPDPHNNHPWGAFAYGGDLRVPRIIAAYKQGIFPWFSFERDTPIWYCPMQRFVIKPSEIHVSHSMRNLINRGEYEVSFDRDFDGVIRGCAMVNGRYMQQGAWLGERIITVYTHLFKLGVVHSVEVWNRKTGALAGGLYGGYTGRCFMGESMFSCEPSASKLALIGLAQKLRGMGDTIIDCQERSAHLASMGGRFMDYDTYLTYLTEPTGDNDKSE